MVSLALGRVMVSLPSWICLIYLKDHEIIFLLSNSKGGVTIYFKDTYRGSGNLLPRFRPSFADSMLFLLRQLDNNRRRVNHRIHLTPYHQPYDIHPN